MQDGSEMFVKIERENQEELDHLEYLGVGERNILRWVLKKEDAKFRLDSSSSE
jgi:hypothetical protein